MNKSTFPLVSRFASGLFHCLLLAVALTAAAKANAQTVFLTFTGGNGSEVVITWSSPIVYTLTGSTQIGAVNPTFVFQAIANSQSIFQTSAPVGGVAPTYTSTGTGSTDGTQTINTFSTPNTFNAVTAGDVVFYATADTAPTFLTSGDVYTLSAGSLRYNGSPATSAGYNGALPANGLYNTFIVDGSSTYLTNLGNGVSAVPEPSTYAAILGAAALGLVIYRRRQKLA